MLGAPDVYHVRVALARRVLLVLDLTSGTRPWQMTCRRGNTRACLDEHEARWTSRRICAPGLARHRPGQHQSGQNCTKTMPKSPGTFSPPPKRTSLAASIATAARKDRPAESGGGVGTNCLLATSKMSSTRDCVVVHLPCDGLQLALVLRSPRRRRRRRACRLRAIAASLRIASARARRQRDTSNQSDAGDGGKGHCQCHRH